MIVVEQIDELETSIQPVIGKVDKDIWSTLGNQNQFSSRKVYAHLSPSEKAAVDFEIMCLAET
jgi:hypothetical protein